MKSKKRKKYNKKTFRKKTFRKKTFRKKTFRKKKFSNLKGGNEDKQQIWENIIAGFRTRSEFEFNQWKYILSHAHSQTGLAKNFVDLINEKAKEVDNKHSWNEGRQANEMYKEAKHRRETLAAIAEAKEEDAVFKSVPNDKNLNKMVAWMIGYFDSATSDI